MQLIKKEKLSACLRGIDRRTLFVAAFTSLILLFYINPLESVGVTEWDRTFSPALLSGISIEKRLRNFYLLFLCFVPLSFSVATVFYAFLFHIRSSYKKIHVRFIIMLLCAVAAAWLSKFAADNAGDCARMLIHNLLAFQGILAVLALVDAREQLHFSDVVFYFSGYMIAVVSLNILFRIQQMRVSILIAGILLLCHAALICKTSVGLETKRFLNNLICLLMWTPAVFRLALEGIFLFTEKGKAITAYRTVICLVFLVFAALSVCVAFLLRKRPKSLSSLGYAGVITGLGSLSFFAYTYQHVWPLSSYVNVFEGGNAAVLADSVLHGKLPIIDNFSAHALSDVWAHFIYYFIHSDIKTVFAHPYRNLSALVGVFALFYIVKTLFDRDVALLFVCLFPYNYYSVKIASICLISVAALLHILKKPSFRSYLLFWFVLLVSAFTVYDEGMALGIACIFAYLLLIWKERKRLKQFLAGGVIVGGASLLCYVTYALLTGIPVIARLREWVSVSLGSNSTWALADFGDPASFAFLLSYLVVPACATVILIATVVSLIKNKKFSVLAAVVIVFAFAELLYIPRTIVFHNLAACFGRNGGILFNYAHWTISLFVLYLCSVKNVSNEKRLLAWVCTFGILIVSEGTFVTGVLPSGSTPIFASAAESSKNWNLHDGTDDNLGKERIVLDEAAVAFQTQFERLFDALLSDQQTFIDFANVTSLYVLTGRPRPFYVAQSPSLLTGLYSQERYLEEISEYDCPLAILGTTQDSYTQQMTDIPHNVRYYKIAEYIYKNYRPLVRTGDFVVWCKKELHSEFAATLDSAAFWEAGYGLVDYGYDAAQKNLDENGTVQFSYLPYHSFSLGMIPYAWANYDEYEARANDVLAVPWETAENSYVFSGSQDVLTPTGNYIKFECFNPSGENIAVTVTLSDSERETIRYEYSFTVLPGSNTYLIRSSQDYFWEAFSIDSVCFSSESPFQTSGLSILEGD